MEQSDSVAGPSNEDNTSSGERVQDTQEKVEHVNAGNIDVEEGREGENIAEAATDLSLQKEPESLGAGDGGSPERESSKLTKDSELAEDSGDSQEDFVKVEAEDLTTSEYAPSSKEVLSDNAESTTEDIQEEKKPDLVDILGNGSLTKKILVEAQSEGAEKPDQDDWVEVTYETYIAGQDNIVESEVKRKICIQDLDIVQGIDFALMLMKTTEKSEIFVSADKAYGSLGRASINVPPNTDLKFIFTLEKVIPTPEKDELIEIIERKKARAKELFLGKDYESAVYIYTRCLRHIDAMDLEKNELAMSIKSNLAQGFLNMNRYDLALQHAMSVVNNDPSNTKALLRLGKAYHNLGDLRRAERVLAKASNLEPSNKSISNELNLVKTKSKKSLDNQKKIYGKMFGFDKSEKSTKSKKEGNTQYYVAGAVVTAGLASLCYSLYKTLT